MSTARLQLSLSGKDLKNLSGLFDTSDPFAVVTLRGDNKDNKPTIIGRTDVVFNNLNPEWSTIVFLDGYKFGVPFFIEVGVFDFDAKAAGTTEKKLQLNDAQTNLTIVCDASSQALLRKGQFPHRVMGTALFEVGEILGARGNVCSKKLQTGGAIYAHVERCLEDGEEGKLCMQLRAMELRNTQIGRTSCPFFELLRKVNRPSGATWIKVYQSNVVKHDLQPIWNEATLDLAAICNGDLDRAMKVVIWDHKRSGRHKLMGEFETTVRGFLDASKEDSADENDISFDVRKQDNKRTGRCMAMKAKIMDGRSRHRDSGGGGSNHRNDSSAASSRRNTHSASRVTERMAAASLSQSAPPSHAAPPRNNAPRPEFIDYLTGGCQISLAVAIDFTASNGDPRVPGTPHYFHTAGSKQWNDYEKAIFAVGSILAKYDSDNKFPVWGFGAKYNEKVRHCFQCGTNVEVEGVQGIMDAYRGVFRTPLRMSFPTKFNEVIQTAGAYAQHEQEFAQEDGHLSYTILLILTAGNVEDVEETKQFLAKAGEEPLSVVILGIGDADFSGMEFLDAFDAETERGRDITKFVEFNDYKSYNALTEAVLDEIPEQLVSYFYERGIMPGQDEGFDTDNVEIQPPDDDDRTYTFLG
mmetsp:Transcript_18886/g.38763  ORF Transcript_18886/g.38763 Transcript_18886/m.38763 type:complete len:638 (-) Transcript_18886:449-2362(-)|eukprot:CAMPEP_0201120336 /NCGR_PEP_ID=MMETSP0850-20130426/4405_1 /ASSEMBLY_ACC=CAM_ASM_000622 /TAXON_ID=183588 /ORGANISM="Pseudo-nitzschia fraudulenta, Strain WWA7" /LENGTH=637 /DNA_ID=CAMNT_0047386441 /DNA_START=94 /DNA_END=2010 /DNA_ORIENTATION=-